MASSSDTSPLASSSKSGVKIIQTDVLDHLSESILEYDKKLKATKEPTSPGKSRNQLLNDLQNDSLIGSKVKIPDLPFSEEDVSILEWESPSLFDEVNSVEEKSNDLEENTKSSLVGVNEQARKTSKSAHIASIKANQSTKAAKVVQQFNQAQFKKIGKTGASTYVIQSSQLLMCDTTGNFSDEEIQAMHKMWVNDCWDGLEDVSGQVTIMYFLKALPKTTPSSSVISSLLRADRNLKARQLMTAINEDREPKVLNDILSNHTVVVNDIPSCLIAKLEAIVNTMKDISARSEELNVEMLSAFRQLMIFTGEIKSGQSDFLASAENKMRQIIAHANKQVQLVDSDTGSILRERLATNTLSTPFSAPVASTSGATAVLSDQDKLDRLFGKKKTR
ncbi:hypothetical protein [Hexartovirus lepeophtheiri]|uniref:Uncharacterized protein n=1 Tax=Lepeophtheirus virus LS24 TaxID=2080823 RepID=A0A3G1NGZ4_9MONO|nr:hypothetical protein QKJ68_gp3 [Lepeophtheirus virus LS24]AUZ99697.1 hypothetical protein [Lepeophtheirus virus LS24]